MPIYQFEGKHYDLSTADPTEAKNKILTHLGRDVPKNVIKDFEGSSNMGPDTVGPKSDYLTGAANVMTGMAGGVFGAGAAATTPFGKHYLDRAAERADEAKQAFTEKFRPFNSEASRGGEEQIGEGLDWATQKAGAGVDWLSKKQLELEGVKVDPKTEMMREAVARGVGETAAQFVPLERGIQAARGIGRPKPAAPLTPEQIANQQIITKAQERAKAQGRTEVTPDDIRAVTKYEYQGGVDYPGPDVTDMQQQPPKQPPLQGMPGVELDYPQMERQGALDLRSRAPEPQSPLTAEPQQLKLPFDRTQLDETFSTPGFNRTAEQVMDAREFGNKEMEPPIYGKAQARPDELGAVKEPGGMWDKNNGVRKLTQMLIDALHPKSRNPMPGERYRSDSYTVTGREAESSDPMLRWADKAARNYLNKYMGTARDPLKDIQIPFEPHSPNYDAAPRPARWEDITDQMIGTEPGKYQHHTGWASDKKIKPEESIYKIGTTSENLSDVKGYKPIPTYNHNIQYAAERAFRDYVKHAYDYMLEKGITPEMLEKNYDFTRLIRETAQWDKELASRMAKKKQDAMKNATVVKKYPDGYSWIKLDKPGQFAAESDMMGHSVRGYEPSAGLRAASGRDWRGVRYDEGGPHPDWVEAAGDHGREHYGFGGWEAIKGGDAEVYSLRDKEGQAHVTIEVSVPTAKEHRMWESARRTHPDTTAETPRTQPAITQIKGKQNRAPEQKYLQYVQDFVNSKEWSNVGDIQNTGLVSWKEKINSTDTIQHGWRERMMKDAETFFGKRQYVTKEQWDHFMKGGRDPNIFNELSKDRGAEASKKVADAFGEKEVVINNDEFNKTLAEHAERGDFRGALEHIMSNSGNPFYRWLADTLLLDPKFSPKLVVYDTLPGRDGMMMAGQWQVGQKTIALAREGGWHGSEMILLHEAVHARVAELQYRYENGMSVPKSVKSNIEAIDKLYNYVRENLPKELKEEYAMSDAYEFLAHGLTDRYFQEVLQEINLPKGLFFEKRKEGVFSAFKGFMHYLLGVLKNMGFGKLDLSAPNALAVFLNESAAALREIGYNPSVAKVAYGPEGLEWAHKLNADLGAMPWVKKAKEVSPESKSEYSKKLEEKEGKDFANRWGAALHDEYLKQWKRDNAPSTPQVGYDNRGHDTFKREDLFRADGSRRIDDTGYIFPAGPAYTMAEAHPVIRRVYDQVSQASVNKDNLFNKWFRRAEIVDRTWNPIFGRFTAMQTKGKVDHPDSLSVLMGKMSDKEWLTALELKNRYAAQHPDYLSDAMMLRANGATTKVVKFFNELESVTKTVLGEINKAREARGKEPIAYRPGWMWSQAREGAYQVFSHDANARHTYLAGFNNFADAEKVAQYLRKEKGMDVTADMADHNPRSVDIFPSDAFFEAAGMLEDPKARKLVMDAAEEAIKRLGINKYALTRDSKIGGFAGSKELIDSLGVGKAADGVAGSIEKYLQRAANYVGSAEASKKVGELLLDYDIQKNYPHATAKARYMWEQYQGVPRALDEVFRMMSKGLSTLPGLKQLGFSDKTLENTTSFAGQAFTVSQLVWWNPTFYIANALQNFVVPSRMQQLKSTVLGDKGNITEALLKAELHMAIPTEASKEIWHKALDNGSLEAKFVEALDWSRAPATEAVKMVMGENVAAFADSYSRGKAYASFYELAKSAGYDETQSHSFAARESQGTMVQYDRWARMPILNKLGPIGDSVAPLTGFVTNMAFRLGDYALHATKGKMGTHVVAPLMTLLGLQVALAGIKGSPFYTDLEDMYMALNTHFVKEYGFAPWRTPSQLMADAGIPSWLQYGIPSALADANMSGTLGMGQVAGNLGQMVGWEYMSNAVKGFYKLAQQAMMGNQTKQDVFDDVNKMLPPMAKEWLRSMLDGQSPLTPAKVQQGEGLTYQRSQREQISALLTGRAPLKESETKIAKHHGTQIESATKDAKTQARDVLVDNVISGADLSPYVMRVLLEYPDEMLDNVDRDIEHRILALNIPHEERVLMKNKANQRLLQLWQDVYRNKNENFR